MKLLDDLHLILEDHKELITLYEDKTKRPVIVDYVIKILGPIMSQLSDFECYPRHEDFPRLVEIGEAEKSYIEKGPRHHPHIPAFQDIQARGLSPP